MLEVYFPCSRELCGVSAILRHFLPWPLKITHRKTGPTCLHIDAVFKSRAGGSEDQACKHSHLCNLSHTARTRSLSCSTGQKTATKTEKDMICLHIFIVPFFVLERCKLETN